MIHPSTDRAIKKYQNALAVLDIVRPHALIHIAIFVHENALSVPLTIHELAGIHLRAALHEQRPLAVMMIAMPHAVIDIAVGIDHGSYAVFLILIPLAVVHAQSSGIPTLAVALSHVVDKFACVSAPVGVGHDAPAVSVAGDGMTAAHVAFVGFLAVGRCDDVGFGSFQVGDPT